nr:MAG TPA: hypothetical protein [Caudoviricetes sp.]
MTIKRKCVIIESQRRIRHPDAGYLSRRAAQKGEQLWKTR